MPLLSRCTEIQKTDGEFLLNSRKKKREDKSLRIKTEFFTLRSHVHKEWNLDYEFGGLIH